MTPRREFPLAAWLFFEVLHILTYTVKSVWLRRVLFLAILSICTYASIYTSMDFSRIGMGKRGITSRLPIVVLFVSANAILKDPLKDIRRIGQKEDVSNTPFLTRLWRGLHLWISTRGVNYAHEPTSSLPPRPTQKTKWAFVLAQLKAIALDFVVFDLVSIMNRANPYFTADVPVVVGSQRLVWWFAGFGFGATIGPLMSMQHRVLTIIIVVLGISKPYDCPAYFGSPLEAYTVRRLWGKTWHQTLRIGCVTHAEYFARRLRLPPKSKMTSAIKLMIVFVVSGVLHWIGEAVPVHSLKKTVGTLIFFLLQIVAILTEQMVISFGQKMGIKSGTKWKVIGYLWVFLWINATLPIWTAEGFRGGWIEELPHFSIILGILRGEWFPVNKPLGRLSS